ncbi:MAG: hypothetical protein HY718_21580 [Planctomycetes bacterium]|nr:hypothetical protein [Planctomycetota bacterium]
MAVMNARAVALRALGDLREGRRTSRQAIDGLLERYRLSPREVSFASELVHGVVRHRLTLATVLSRFMPHRWQRIGRRLQHILMLGAYQIIWLDGVPVFAAVNEAVELAKAEGGRRAGQFANAVLRQLERRIQYRRIVLAEADPVRAVPLDLAWACQFSEPVLPDPGQKLVEYLSQATSHPGWLVARWVDAYGAEQARTICQAGMLRPPIILRPHRGRTDLASLMKRLTVDGHEPQLTADGESIVLGRSAGLVHSSLLAEGLAQPQDPTARLPVRQMALQPGQVVLDLCAGLGTKATQMAEIMGGAGLVVATDADDAKVAALRDHAERLGHHVIEPVPLKALADRVQQLDRLNWILIDAPCSNTGVLARRPEIRYRLTARSLGQLAEMQLRLLGQAAALARPQTRLMYSTCSIDPEENEQVCTRFVETHPDWRYVDGRLTLPNPGPTIRDWHDGGYWAILAL